MNRILVIRICNAYYTLSKVERVAFDGHKYSNYEKLRLDHKEQVAYKSVSFQTHSSSNKWALKM